MFPQLLYHASGRTRTVNDEAERESVLSVTGWQTTPFPPVAVAPEFSVEQRFEALEERVSALETRKKK